MYFIQKAELSKIIQIKILQKNILSKEKITWFLLLNSGNLKCTVELLEFVVVQISWYSQVDVPLNHELEASTKKINYGYKVTFPFVDSYQRIHENTSL